jgi:hypothetical protein
MGHHPPPPVHTTTAPDRASGWLQVIDRSCKPASVRTRSGQVAAWWWSLGAPEREDDRRSRWSSLWSSGAVRSTRASASHGLTDHLPVRHGRAMSALRPSAWAPHPHVRSPSHKRSAGTAWPNGAPHGRKRRPRKPVPRPLGWHLGGVGLAQADRVGGDGALRAVPGVGAVRTSGRWGADRLVHTLGS